MFNAPDKTAESTPSFTLKSQVVFFGRNEELKNKLRRELGFEYGIF